MDLTVKVCDVCRSQARATRRWTLTVDGKKVERDLCSLHDRSLVTLLNLNVSETVTQAPPKQAGKPRSGRRLATVEEVEAMRAKS